MMIFVSDGQENIVGKVKMHFFFMFPFSLQTTSPCLNVNIFSYNKNITKCQQIFVPLGQHQG